MDTIIPFFSLGHGGLDDEEWVVFIEDLKMFGWDFKNNLKRFVF